jgi:chromosome partitioning protein
VLSTLLSSIKGNYDYILIDTPSSLGLLSMNALTAADEVIIPLRCDVRIFEGMAELLRTINDVNNTLNPQLTIAGFLVTHVNRELRSTPLNLKEIHTCYGNKVFQTLIPNNDDLLVYYKQFATELSA